MNLREVMEAENDKDYEDNHLLVEKARLEKIIQDARSEAEKISDQIRLEEGKIYLRDQGWSGRHIILVYEVKPQGGYKTIVKNLESNDTYFENVCLQERKSFNRMIKSEIGSFNPKELKRWLAYSNERGESEDEPKEGPVPIKY